jgi:hypothetical protein
LSGTQFSTLNSAGINDPEGPEKYNNTEATLNLQFSYLQFAGQAVNQFSSTSCLHFSKELITSVHARAEVQWECL